MIYPTHAINKEYLFFAVSFTSTYHVRGGETPKNPSRKSISHNYTQTRESSTRQIGANIYFILFFVLYLFVPLSSAPAANHH